MGLTSNIKDKDWVSVRQGLAKLGSLKLGSTSTPVYAGLTLTGLTVNSLIYPVLADDGTSTGALTSLGAATDGQLPIGDTGAVPVLATLTGTANEIDVTNGAGTITIGIVNPLIVAKGGTGAATFTDHSILLGSGTAAFTALGVAGNGYIPIGSAGADPVLALLTGTANQIISTPGAGSITLSTPQDIHTGASPTFVTVDLTGITDSNIPYMSASGFADSPLSTNTTDVVSTGVIQAPDFAKTGWPLTPGVTLSFDDASKVFTVTDGGSAYYYIDGVKYVLGGNKTVDLDTPGAAEGIWYIYFDGAILTASQTPWVIENEDKCFVALLYWDNTNNKETLLGYELHNFIMDASTHERLHDGGGAAWVSGLLVSDASSEQVNVSAGGFHDEDISIEISDGAGAGLFEQVLSPAELPIYYRSGASDWRIYETTDKANAVDAGYVSGSNELHYNKLNGTWASTYVGAAKYVAYYVVSINDTTEPVAMIMGQRIDNTLATAKANNVFSGLSLSGLPFQEMIILARLILKQSGSGVYYTLEEITDLRATNAQGNVTSPLITDHGGLGGLGDDDHAQYLLADGTRALAGAWNMGSQILTNVNIDSGDINVAVTNTEWDTAYSHSQLASGNPHSVTPTELSLVIGTNTQAWDAGLDSLAGLTYASDSFIKVTATDTYAIRTIAETKTDLSLNLVENTAHSTDAHTMTIDGVDVSVHAALNIHDAVADTADTSCWVGLFESATGDLAPKTDGGLTYNAGTAALSTTTFIGALTGQADTVGTITGLAPDTATTQATQASITTCANLTTVGTIGTGTWQSTDVGIAYGGTGQSTAQAAIDALSAVSGATNEHVLTKDTASGNAVWKAAAAAGGAGGGTTCLFSWFYDSVIQGTWLIAVDTSQLFNGYIYTSTTNNGDEINFKTYLGAGTYTLKIIYIRNTDEGIVDIYIDAAEVASFDFYGTILYNTIQTQASISVAAGGVKTIRAVIDGKNGSSSDYKAPLTALIFYRTA